jgi:hypothetical protein
MLFFQAMRTFVEASVVERGDRQEKDNLSKRAETKSRSAAKRTPINKVENHFYLKLCWIIIIDSITSESIQSRFWQSIFVWKF